MTARAFLATILALLFSAAPLSAKRFGDASDPDGATVLCYHIVESPLDSRMEISRDTFRQHLQYLEMTGYNVIPLRHLYEYVTGRRSSLPPNPVVITIHDGWRSTYTEAYPELKKRGFPFTVFIYPQIIGKTATALTWGQIREMAKNGGDIESHSLSHPFLTRRRHADLADDKYYAWLQKELVDSKRILEKQTGNKVEFIAYPYGDYDHVLAHIVGKAGYTAALTCDFGKVIKGSDPLRMRRFVVDKRMDFAAFRKYMGATPMQLAEMTPKPGDLVEPASAVISARIPNYQTVDPHSVGMALLGVGSLVPYAYDAKTGSITLMINDAMKSLKGSYHRAVVWAKDSKTGKRIEASWTFKLPDEALPSKIPAVAPAQIVPASQPAQPATSRRAVIVPITGGAAIVTANAQH